MAFTPNSETIGRLSLFRGVYARFIQELKDTDDIIGTMIQLSLDAKDLSSGDLAVITAGQPVWSAGITNMIQVKSCR